MVCLLKSIRVACEAQTGWLQVKFEVFRRYVGYGDGEINVVFRRVRVG